MAGEERRKDDLSDPRLDFLNLYLQKTFKSPKGEKWQKFMTTDERVTTAINKNAFPWISINFHFIYPTGGCF
jgi:hypothetical protein